MTHPPRSHHQLPPPSLPTLPYPHCLHNEPYYRMRKQRLSAAITSALQQVKNTEQAHHTAESSTQGLARCLRKAKQSLEEA